MGTARSPTLLNDGQSSVALNPDGSVKLAPRSGQPVIIDPASSGLTFPDGSMQAVASVPTPNYGVKVGLLADQVLSSGVLVPINWGEETFDDNSMHSMTANTNRLVAPASGYYAVYGGLRFAPSTGGTQRAAGYRDSAGQLLAVGAGYTFSALVNTDVIAPPSEIYLIGGDWIEMVGYQDRGFDLAVRQASVASFFGMRRVR